MVYMSTSVNVPFNVHAFLETIDFKDNLTL